MESEESIDTIGEAVYQNWKQEGYDEGHADGVSETERKMQDVIDDLKTEHAEELREEYNKGREAGYDDGYSDGTFAAEKEAEDNLEEQYNEGFEAGKVAFLDEAHNIGLSKLLMEALRLKGSYWQCEIDSALRGDRAAIMNLTYQLEKERT